MNSPLELHRLIIELPTARLSWESLIEWRFQLLGILPKTENKEINSELQALYDSTSMLVKQLDAERFMPSLNSNIDYVAIVRDLIRKRNEKRQTKKDE